MQGDFFNKICCDRCNSDLKNGRTMSWFTEETICLDCSDKESKIKKTLTAMGKDTLDYEGCGYVPMITPIKEGK